MLGRRVVVVNSVDAPVYQDLSSKLKTQMASGQENINIFMLLAVTQSVDNLSHSFIVLCENEYFLISNLH